MIDDLNQFVLERLSAYLNDFSTYISKEMVREFSKSVDFDDREIIIYLIADMLKYDRYVVDNYLLPGLKELDNSVYENDLYYKNIKFGNIKRNKWSLKHHKYEPYELFVYNDIFVDEKGRTVPQIGYFKKVYKYPVICENDREWMMVTPNEIETMKEPISNAFGNVLTFGLGLGYFAYMASLKENVKSITIVEKDKDAILLFEENILPQFENKSKIKIIQDDAFTFEYDSNDYDYVFVDIWHDPSDGVEAYKYFKEREKENVKYDYWALKTLKVYM